VGLLVPPVLLTVNERSDQAERHAAISLVMSPLQISWGAIDDRLAREVPPEFAPMLPRIPVPASHAFAFDTWVGQSDHVKPSNVVFGYEEGRPENGELVFLDYAFSMGIFGGWDERKHLEVQPAPFPDRLCDRVTVSALSDMVQRIEALSDEVITDIVRRIPFQWLREGEATPILTGLLTRRGLVRRALAGYLEKAP
jgi:hypothetical protein